MPYIGYLNFRALGKFVTFPNIGRQRKKEGKTCVTSVTILMFKKFRQTTPSMKQICLQKP